MSFWSWLEGAARNAAGKAINIGIEGIQRAQQDNERMIANMRPDNGSASGRAVQYAMIEAHRHAVAFTHVKTGALRGSHRMAQSGLRGEIYIDPRSVNPVTGDRPYIYGVEEEGRGGSHSFYLRTLREGEEKINAAAWAGFRSKMP